MIELRRVKSVYSPHFSWLNEGILGEHKKAHIHTCGCMPREGKNATRTKMEERTNV